MTLIQWNRDTIPLWSGVSAAAACFRLNTVTCACVWQNLRCGTTGVVTFLRGQTLYVAWLGDSQVILVRRGQVVELMKPHKPDREVTTYTHTHTSIFIHHQAQIISTVYRFDLDSAAESGESRWIGRFWDLIQYTIIKLHINNRHVLICNMHVHRFLSCFLTYKWGLKY